MTKVKFQQELQKEASPIRICFHFLPDAFSWVSLSPGRTRDGLGRGNLSLLIRSAQVGMWFVNRCTAYL